MAGLTAPGVGSGLDVAGLVQQLVAAERAPHSLRLNRAEAGAKARLSAYGTLSAAFDALKKTLDPLKGESIYGAKSARSSADTVFTASATRDTPVGTYEVKVEALATAHKLTSQAKGENDTFGAGELAFDVGGKLFTVAIEDGSTLAQVRDAIAAAAKEAEAELDVGLIRSDDGVHLVLASRKTGAANAIEVTRNSGDASLDALVYDPDGLMSLEQKTAAADARVRVDGLLTTSATNAVSGVLPGLTLNLKSAAPDEVKTLTVSADNSSARGAIEGFVKAYNAAVTAMKNATAYNAEKREASTLTGDSVVRAAASQLRGALGGVLGAGVGLTTNTDGTLAFDAAKFNAAIEADPDAVKAAFDGDTGLARRLGDAVNGFVGADGAFTGRTDGLNKRLKEVSEQREALDRRMELIEARYRAQFTALDSMIAQLNTTSQFLAQRLAPPQQS